MRILRDESFEKQHIKLTNKSYTFEVVLFGSLSTDEPGLDLMSAALPIPPLIFGFCAACDEPALLEVGIAEEMNVFSNIRRD